MLLLIASLYSSKQDQPSLFASAADDHFSITITTTTAPIDKGNAIPLTVTLHNQSASPLENVTATVLLDGVALVGCGLDTPIQLATDSLRGYTCTANGADRDLELQAVAQGLDNQGNRVEAHDTVLVDVMAPQIVIDLSADRLMVLRNSPITYSVAVTNNGNFRLNYVGVLDTQVPNCALEEERSRILDVGMGLQYTCIMTQVTADFTHTIRAEASPPVGRFVFDEDHLAIDVISPALTLEKTPALQNVNRDGEASFLVKVTNVGDVPLTDIVIADSHTADCDHTASIALRPGEFIGYSCTQPVTDVDLQTQVTVQANTPIDTVLQDSTMAEVDVQSPQISLLKTPTDLLLSVGEQAHFSITITNSGNADLTDVQLIDAAYPDCNHALETLQQGESHTYSCQKANVTASLTSTLQATAKAVTPPWESELVTKSFVSHVEAALLASVGDQVWEDQNYNGIQDEGEPGIAGIALRLYHADDGRADDGREPLYTTVSDDHGRYTFDKLFAGEYQLEVLLPPNLAIAPTRAGMDDALDSNLDVITGQTAAFIVAEGTNGSDLDIGLYYPVQVGGAVWYDSDLDGLRDVGELGIADVTLALYQEDVLFAEVDTLSDGRYLFDELVPARYHTVLTKPGPNYRFSTSEDAVAGSSPDLILHSGDQITQLNTGLYALPLISGQVWNATDYNGIRGDDAEPSAGVIARLYTMPNSDLVDAVNTDEQGGYTFSNLPEGAYYVELQPPIAGFFGSPVQQGNNPSLDSDIYFSGRTSTLWLTATTEYRAIDAGLNFIPQQPTDSILNLRTTPMQNAIHISWLALTDPLTRGYHLWRGRAEGGEGVAVRLTANEMPIKLTGAVAEYTLLDVDVQPAIEYLIARCR